MTAQRKLEYIRGWFDMKGGEEEKRLLSGFVRSENQIEIF
jgi:hypothetical protein